MNNGSTDKATQRRNIGRSMLALFAGFVAAVSPAPANRSASRRHLPPASDSHCRHFGNSGTVLRGKGGWTPRSSFSSTSDTSVSAWPILSQPPQQPPSRMPFAPIPTLLWYNPELAKTVMVFAVPHQLQGEKFPGFVPDRSYGQLIDGSIERGTDFIFEEASGLGPTVAEDLARSHLRSSRYMDIDPPRAERKNYGIAEETGEGFPIDPYSSSDMYYRLFVDAHQKREELWLDRIQKQTFDRGLLICGLAHNLSFAFRLLSVGINAEAYNYIPYGKLHR